MKSLGILLALVVTLSACAPGDLGGGADAGPDARVLRNRPTVFIEPQNAPVRPFRAVVLPFGDQGSAPSAQSKALTAVLADTWTRSQAFAAVHYESDQERLTHDEAILVARDRGADCVVIGRMGGILEGGDTEDSTASLSFEIFDVNSGQRIWSMTASGSMSPGGFFSFLERSGGTSGPNVPAIVTALAYDTGDLIRRWNHGEGYSTPHAARVPVSVPDEHAPPPPPKKPLHVRDLSS